jgi:hypothetical protein
MSRTRSLVSILFGLLVLAAGTVNPLTVENAVASSPPGPTFNIPAALQDLHVTVGERVDLSYCVPRPKPGSFCGGPFAHGQVNPIGGISQVGKYNFGFKGLIPYGLVLHTNGLLTGTVSSLNMPRTWKFSLCASDESVAPEAGTVGSTCRPTEIVVESKYPYDGMWTGTFTYVLTTDNLPQGLSITEDASATVQHGVITDLSASVDGISSIFFFAGSNSPEEYEPSIPSSGSVQITSCSGGVDDSVDGNGESFTTAENSFSIHFASNGEAGNSVDFSCQGTDGSGNPASLSDGKITLSLTSP